MLFITRPVDRFLNGITMYRLLLYGLAILIAVGVLFGYTGILSISGTGILATTAVVIATSYLVNKSLGHAYNATTNNESYLITALILALILPPTTDAAKLAYIALAAIIATASKFVIAYHHKHIFNPAALGAVAVSLLGLLSITWWVGTPIMLPFVAVFGFLIVRKIQRSQLLIAFLVAAFSMTILVCLVSGHPIILILKTAVLSGPLIFFATVMLTEPATMPSTQYYQILFGILVGVAYASQLHSDFLNTNTSPQLVLLGGNVFAFMFNHKTTLKLRLKEKIRISAQVYDFVFTPNRPLVFYPGQYMEWTLGHKHVDGRGNRRSFTMASSPTEDDVHLGVKFYEPSSSYKTALRSMKPGQMISASQLSGNFVLPTDHTKKLVFIAGGIGITPFRSMAKYIIDSGERRDIVLLYLVGKHEELAYMDVFKKTPGMKVLYLVNTTISAESLAKNVPDFMQRMYFISGPNGLVDSYRELLHRSGIHASHIRTDHFSGY